jgi:DNA-binding NarL/FixJ family response regulator
MMPMFIRGYVLQTNQIMLVDDNQDFLAVSQEFLEAFEGLRVVGTATSGREALDLLGRISPTLLIVDVSMPEMNGLELTQQVKKRWPNLPIIVLTLLDTPLHRQAALQAGADAFVTKASMDDDLIPAIQGLQIKRKNGNTH